MTDERAQGVLLGWQDPVKKGFPQPMWHHGEGHLMTIAPTGSGKGVSCVIPALLTWPGPAIVIDPKGENTLVTAARRRALGQKVVVLDPFSVTGVGDDDGFNPLDIVRPGTPTAADDMALVVELLIQGQTFRTDPFWDERASSLIQDAMASVFATMPRRLHHLGSVKGVIDVETEGPMGLTVAKRPHLGLASLAYGLDRTRASILATASSHVSFIRSGAVERSLASSSFTLDEIVRGVPLTVYLVLPPDRLATHRKLLRLWLGVLMAAMARRRRPPPLPTLVLVDEAAQLGELQELRTALTVMRGYGVKVWTFWQDLTQLQTVYPRDWQSLVNNSGVQQVFVALSPQAKVHLRDYFGPLMDRPYRDLKPTEQLLSLPGEPLKVVRRLDYRRDPCFAGLYDRNPFYDGTER